MTDHGAWAEKLSEAQLSAALYELRRRKFAVAVYDLDTANDIFDISDLPKARAWFEENYEALEETMCDAARDFIREGLEDADALENA